MMTNIRLTLMSDSCRWIHQVATYHRIRHLPLPLLLLRFPPTIVPHLFSMDLLLSSPMLFSTFTAVILQICGLIVLPSLSTDLPGN